MRPWERSSNSSSCSHAKPFSLELIMTSHENIYVLVSAIPANVTAHTAMSQTPAEDLYDPSGTHFIIIIIFFLPHSWTPTCQRFTNKLQIIEGPHGEPRQFRLCTSLQRVVRHYVKISNRQKSRGRSTGSDAAALSKWNKNAYDRSLFEQV